MYKCTFILNDSFKVCATISKAISKFALAYPAVFRFRAGSLDVLAMLLHHTTSFPFLASGRWKF
jgi:hypothetical protein